MLKITEYFWKEIEEALNEVEKTSCSWTRRLH